MSRRGGEHGDAATRTWRAVQALVTGSDRREAVTEALGVSFGRVKALRRLLAGPATMRELADRLGADPPYVTLMVDDLEGLGLVVREPHPQDRRAKLVRLTPAGRRAATRAEQILEEPPEPWRDLPADLLERLEQLLPAPGDPDRAGSGS